ncbi:hypothetical protein SRB5_57170 [Streptomyces sp. RB5]|uniref:N-acetyltransferase domain-containing protein n=1 Tax=Streptomyces smaragdinus TaxID=2585196 RepID=A0A7K0CPW9_9ACTN|nr:GNAT family N-acetyltransferase [Streptomyces smaragdinus]MQY15535.1 hypothetical protein [Streptomyces smaragdinus]
MKIRTGGPADSAVMIELFDGAVRWLAGLGRTGQWGTSLASESPARREHFEEYARDMTVRVAETDDGRAVGVCVLVEEPPESVSPAAERELYIRLLLTDRALKGGGIGAALVADAREEAVRRGISLLRVDCYAGDDQALVRRYEALGFRRAESFTVEREGLAPWPGQVLGTRV